MPRETVPAIEQGEELLKMTRVRFDEERELIVSLAIALGLSIGEYGDNAEGVGEGVLMVSKLIKEVATSTHLRLKVERTVFLEFEEGWLNVS